MIYTLDKNRLLDILGEWNRFLKRKVHLIACGGTAMTLIGVKFSTKDVDFMTPKVSEHDYVKKQECPMLCTGMNGQCGFAGVSAQAFKAFSLEEAPTFGRGSSLD